jgi:hypothetical protein
VRTPARHSLITWVCLLALLTRALLHVGAVHCSDGHRGGRLELTCVRDAAGRCLNTVAPATAAEEPGQAPDPCDDRPLAAEPSLARAATAAADDLKAPQPLPVAIVESLGLSTDLGVQPARRLERPVDRPPDALGRLRSVILTL